MAVVLVTAATRYLQQPTGRIFWIYKMYNIPIYMYDYDSDDTLY